MADNVTIKGLLELSDAELLEKFGLADELRNLKERLSQAVKLSPKAKTEVERRIAESLSPKLSADSMRWWIEDAARMDKNKAARDDDSPTSVL